MADILAAISVLLVFLTFLLTGLQKDVDDLLDLPKPPAAQSEKLKKVNQQILNMLLLKALPVSFVFLIIFYLLLPNATHIILISKLSLWNFDVLSTLFVFIEIGVLGLAIFGFIKTVQLLEKYKSSN